MEFKEQWDYDGDFLTQFVPLARSTVANWFCDAVRQWKTRNQSSPSVDEVLEKVGDHCHDAGQYNRSRSALDNSGVQFLYEALDTEEASRFAKFIIWREGLSAEESERLKNGINREARAEVMDSQPPTEKQLSYLRYLKCSVVPLSKLEASQLIGEYKK